VHQASVDHRDRMGLGLLGLFLLLSSDLSARAGEGSLAPVHSVANQCYLVGVKGPGRRALLSATPDGSGYRLVRSQPRRATRFRLRPTDLGTYLLYDDRAGYLVSDGIGLQRATRLLSDVLLNDDRFQSPAEWELVETAGGNVRRYLRHRNSGRYLGTEGVVAAADQAAPIRLFRRRGCAEFPEASVDAKGTIRKTEFSDGSLFGFVDAHSHLFSNFAFGGGGIFHGSPFHRLGVEHALPDCSVYHGMDGRRDVIGYGFGNQGDTPTFLIALATGQLPNPDHVTAGWPDFTDWPDAPRRPTHQTQYYKWLERAYRGGLRLVVQHATTNQILCDLVKGAGIQPTRYACNEMVAVDRIIQETYALQDYVDAQAGGPGKGWFRIVTSPAQARQEIRDGKLAVILGIETSNLFDCFLVPSASFPACTEADVIAKLDAYRARGVRAIFPVHKYDNAFSAGDGQKGIIEIANFIQTGHNSNFVSDCASVPTVFDRGAAGFPGVIMPRDDFFAPPPNDLSGFAADPLGTLQPFFPLLLQPPTNEEVCQAAGLTPLGEFLVRQMMHRGMIIEVDHLPRRSYRRAYEILAENDYPAAGTHHLNNLGELYRLGGVSATDFGICRSGEARATVDDGFQQRVQLIRDKQGFPAEGLALDLNGFAGARGPRFGPRSSCATPQTDPVQYPFRSYAGDVEFTAPQIGRRVLDFNTEGLVHLGLLPEVIEDVRRDGVSDADLEPFFKSAEGYIRMWEKAEARAMALP
jgi:microsomal dipeptidase-like Zn-dependent dipeptidase